MARTHYKAAKRQKELAKKKKKEEKHQRKLEKKQTQPEDLSESFLEETRADLPEESRED